MTDDDFAAYQAERKRRRKYERAAMRKNGCVPVRKVNQRQAVLEAARGLPQPFTVSQLVVAVWKRWPSVFGLAGYEREYPDKSRVFVTLCGRRGLIAAGLVEKCGEGLLRVTNA